MATMQKITPNLWFDNQAEDAANFYVSVFPDSRIGTVTRYGKEGFEIHGRPEGSVMVIEFFLGGQQFTALNGGPVFTFSEAISFIIHCDGQEEIDHYWNKLLEGGDAKAQQCGWLKDRFGLSWQVVPTILPELLRNPATAEKAMRSMLQMKKIDIATLQYVGKE